MSEEVRHAFLVGGAILLSIGAGLAWDWHISWRIRVWRVRWRDQQNLKRHKRPGETPDQFLARTAIEMRSLRAALLYEEHKRPLPGEGEGVDGTDD